MDSDVMFDVFLICFLIGATIMVCQFLLSLLGLGGHHDLGGDGHDLAGPDLHDVGGHEGGGHEGTAHEGTGHEGSTQSASSSDWIFSVLTLRTIVAALTFFGLTGLAMQQTDLPQACNLTVALAGGAAALFLVAWVMRSLRACKRREPHASSVPWARRAPST